MTIEKSICKNCLHLKEYHLKFFLAGSKFLKTPCSFELEISGDEEPKTCGCSKFQAIPQSEGSIFFEDGDDFVVKTADKKLYRIRLVFTGEKSFWQIKEESSFFV